MHNESKRGNKRLRAPIYAPNALAPLTPAGFSRKIWHIARASALVLAAVTAGVLYPPAGVVLGLFVCPACLVEIRQAFPS